MNNRIVDNRGWYNLLESRILDPDLRNDRVGTTARDLTQQKPAIWQQNLYFAIPSKSSHSSFKTLFSLVVLIESLKKGLQKWATPNKYGTTCDDVMLQFIAPLGRNLRSAHLSKLLIQDTIRLGILDSLRFLYLALIWCAQWCSWCTCCLTSMLAR